MAAADAVPVRFPQEIVPGSFSKEILALACYPENGRAPIASLKPPSVQKMPDEFIAQR